MADGWSERGSSYLGRSLRPQKEVVTTNGREVSRRHSTQSKFEGEGLNQYQCENTVEPISRTFNGESSGQ